MTEISTSFANLEKVTTLYLYKNELHNISTGCFDGLWGLSILSLHANKLTKIPSGTFRKPTALNWISVSTKSVIYLWDCLEDFKGLDPSICKIKNLHTLRKETSENLRTLQATNLRSN